MNEYESPGQHEGSGAVLDRGGIGSDGSETPAKRAAGREADHAARRALDGRLIAKLRAEGLSHEEHAAHLTEALRSSRKIGAAIGIVMADLKVSELVAFEILSRVSQDSNRKLSDIAHEVVDQGTARNLRIR